MAAKAWDKLRAGEPYRPGMRGWVVEHRARWVQKPSQPPRYSVGYWYGPSHGWGTTSGGLDYCVRVWPTKTAAEQALRAVFSVPSVWQRHGYRPVRVADAEKT